MDKITFQLDGFAEFEQQIKQLAEGYRSDLVARQTLVKAAKNSMETVLNDVIVRAPYDTHRSSRNSEKPHLRNSARLDARIPSEKDKLSDYVNETDSAIAIVSVKKSAVSLSQEFGNARTVAHPYLRVSLKSNAEKVLDALKSELGTIIPEYAKKLSRRRIK
jgi:hypothetical protein